MIITIKENNDDNDSSTSNHSGMFADEGFQAPRERDFTRQVQKGGGEQGET